MAAKKPSSHEEVVNLRRLYPLALRSILRRSIRWVVTVLGIVAGTVYLNLFFDPSRINGMLHQIIAQGSFFVMLVSCGLLGVKLCYEFLYFLRYKYGIEAEHLFVRTGVIIVEESSFPLSRISRIHLDRSFSDFIVGVWDVNVVTVPGRAAVIEGLSLRSATGLQNHLFSFLETHEAESKKIDTSKESSTSKHTAAEQFGGGEAQAVGFK